MKKLVNRLAAAGLAAGLALITLPGGAASAYQVVPGSGTCTLKFDSKAEAQAAFLERVSVNSTEMEAFVQQYPSPNVQKLIDILLAQGDRLKSGGYVNNGVVDEQRLEDDMRRLIMAQYPLEASLGLKELKGNLAQAYGNSPSVLKQNGWQWPAITLLYRTLGATSFQAKRLWDGSTQLTINPDTIDSMVFLSPEAKSHYYEVMHYDACVQALNSGIPVTGDYFAESGSSAEQAQNATLQNTNLNAGALAVAAGVNPDKVHQLGIQTDKSQNVGQALNPAPVPTLSAEAAEKVAQENQKILNSNSTKKLIALAVGALILLIVLLVLAVWLIRRALKKRKASKTVAASTDNAS